MEQLKEIETILHIASGAPIPIVLSNEYKLNLIYYFEKPEKGIGKELPQMRDNFKDTGVAILNFKNNIIYKFGYPNSEVLQTHPYYKLGLTWYKLFEVIDSEWVKKIEQMNKIHPFHNPLKYRMFKHFIIAFDDSTFECIASDIEITFRGKSTMKEVIIEIGLQLAT